MEKETQRIMIIAALDLTALSYRNFIRSNFEVWALLIAQQHHLLLEDVSTNQSLWLWYQDQFKSMETVFFNANKDYIVSLLDSYYLHQVFLTYIEELENFYPQTIIKNINHV